MSLPPPPTADPLLTEEEIQFLEEDRQRVIDKANTVYKVKVETKAKTVSKSKIEQSKDREICFAYLRSKLEAADPVAKESFANKVEGVEF